MKKSFFYLGFLLSPLIPVIFYLVSVSAQYDSYSGSIVFGVYAFVLVCHQFYLASQPSWLISLLGAKAVRSLHGSAPLLLLLLALIHAVLKLYNGFTLNTFQTLLGLGAFIIFFVGILAALFLFTNTLLTKQKRFADLRAKAYEKTGLSYPRVRTMHNLMVLAGLLVLFHAISASTSSFTYNPWGTAIIIGWMLFTLLSFLKYRLRGRKQKGKK